RLSWFNDVNTNERLIIEYIRRADVDQGVYDRRELLGPFPEWEEELTRLSVRYEAFVDHVTSVYDDLTKRHLQGERQERNAFAREAKKFHFSSVLFELLGKPGTEPRRFLAWCLLKRV